MKNKKLLIISLLILIIILSSYVIFKKQKGNIVTNTTITTNTTKLTLCSNEYYNTEYNKDGKIVIKDFPYRSIKKGEHCQDFEIMATLPFRFSGVIMSEEDRKDLENEYHICYPRDLSLSKISNLSCVQEITLSGMPIVGDMNEQVTNCFFANDDINQLSHLTNLEKIIFDSCSIRNIKSD